MFEKDIKEEAEELFKKKPLGYEMNPELEIYTDGFKDGYNRAKEEVKAPYPSYKHLFGESIEQTALRHSNDLINSLRGDIDYAKTMDFAVS